MFNQVAFWKHEPVADQAAGTLVANTVLFYQQTLGDLVKLTPAGNYQIAERGGKADWQNDSLGRRTFIERFIKAPEDWYTLTAETTALELALVQATRLTRAALPVTVPLYVTLFSPATLAVMLAGPELFARHLQQAPQAVAYAITTLQKSVENLLGLYQQAGANGYFVASQHASASVMTEQDYLRFAKEADDKVLAAAASLGDTILHLHGQDLLYSAFPKAGPVKIHYELHPSNPTPEAFRALSRCEAVIGLPLDVWAKPADYRFVVNSMLQRFMQQSALFTAPCVVPLAVANADIKEWTAHMRLAFA